MYIYRTAYKALLFRKSSTGGYSLYLHDGGQTFKIKGFHGALAHINRNLEGVLRVLAIIKLLVVRPFLKA
jgi:hypothetical protein